jgi:mRNA-degrading endonuclease RelE of RelBE toxin-antitoxin system
VYEIFILPTAQKDLDRLSASIFERVIRKIRALASDARPFGTLKLTAEDGYRLRAGDHRILYRIDEASKRVYVYRIRDRKDAYS